ncbi:MAG: hypothetical protein GF320_21920 [Armatimonadia bacterium]|nr:hypothetical protein [Armatimonadia bacterium]
MAIAESIEEITEAVESDVPERDIIIEGRDGRLSDEDAMAVYVTAQEIIRSGGELNGESLFESAKPKQSPIHHLFEWDPDKAIRTLGISRACTILRRVQITYFEPDNKPVTVRAFESLPAASLPVSWSGHADEDEPRRAYIPIQEVMSDEERRYQHAMKYVKHIASYRDAVAQHEELGFLVKAIDKARRQYGLI